jgi:2-hydroxychromene-2-carboxylate isomerase
MAKQIIDFYWDIGSTNTYFAVHLLPPIAARHDATIAWHPFNLGYVFRANNYVLAEEPRAKLAHRGRDLRRWAEKYDLKFSMPSKFPIKTSVPLRGSLTMRELGLEEPYIRAIFEAYWEQDEPAVATYEGLIPIVERLGVDPGEFEARSESEAIREGLAEETNAGMERGVFGAPTFFVGEEMFWGKDRMEFIEDELAKNRPA